MAIPKVVQASFAKKDLRYPLKTGYFSEAKIRSGLIAGALQMLIRALWKSETALEWGRFNERSGKLALNEI